MSTGKLPNDVFEMFDINYLTISNAMLIFYIRPWNDSKVTKMISCPQSHTKKGTLCFLVYQFNHWEIPDPSSFSVLLSNVVVHPKMKNEYFFEFPTITADIRSFSKKCVCTFVNRSVITSQNSNLRLKSSLFAEDNDFI